MITALLLSALMAASAAVAPASSGPITKDGVEITVLPQIGAAGAPAAVTEVGLDIEAKTADAATRLGFQSLHAIADVDCGKGANRFISAEAYDQPSLAGPGRTRNVTGQWVQPSSDSYMAAVITRICTAPATVAVAGRTRPPPVVKELAAAAPPPVQASPPPAPAPAAAPQAAPAARPPTPPQVVKFSRGAPVAAPPTAAPKPAAAVAPAPAAAPQAAPQPTPPQVVRFSGGAPVATPLAAAAPRPAPAPASAPPPATAAQPPPPSAPLVVKFSDAPTGAAPSSAAAPKRAGDRIAQVAASSNMQDARKVLRELRPLIAPPLTTTIEQAVVGGAHLFRADVVGFETAADAKAFCRSAAQVSKTCWVRAKGDATAPAKPAEHLRAAKRAG